MADPGVGGARLAGRTALVTGGAVRVGRAISLALARHGARVVIHYHSSDREARALEEEIAAGGAEAEIVRADLSTMDGVRGLVQGEGRDFGRVDILINNASLFPAERLDEVDEALWDTTLAVNLRAPFFLTQALGARMKERGWGVVVNVADLAGVQAWSAYAAHAISKAGLIHLTRVAARSLAPEVRVVAIAPGTVLPPEDMPEEEVRRLADRAPLKRIGSADDVAEAVLYLVGADFVTGELLVIDGGRLLR
jgi:pteridine reductase